MKPVELSEFDVNRIIYEETKSVVKELSLLEAVPPTIRPPGPVNRMLGWILSRLGNLLITPAYAPPDQETVERLDAERWRLLKQDLEYIAAIAGMFPIFGDAVDIVMVFYYLSQRDFIGAVFSFLAAAPVIGASAFGIKMAWKAKNFELVAKILKSQSQVRTGVKHPFINPFKKRAVVDKYIKKVEDYLSRELDDVFSDPEQIKRMAKNLKLTHPRGARVKMTVREMEDQIIKRAAEISYGWKTGIWAQLSVFVPMLFVIAYALLYLFELINLSDGRPIARFLAVVDEAKDGLQRKSADEIWDYLTGAVNEINAEARGETLEEAKEKFGSGMKATFSRPGEENFYRLVEDNLGKTKEEAAEMKDRDLIRALFQMYNRDPDDFKWPGGTE